MSTHRLYGPIQERQLNDFRNIDYGAFPAGLMINHVEGVPNGHDSVPLRFPHMLHGTAVEVELTDRWDSYFRKLEVCTNAALQEHR